MEGVATIRVSVIDAKSDLADHVTGFSPRSNSSHTIYRRCSKSKYRNSSTDTMA
jgi:hypothetical protein